MVWGCERLWLYLFGSRFTLATDNRAVQLIYGNVNSRPPPRIERWALRMMQFDCIVVHRPGKDNPADYFSRHPDKTVDLKVLEKQQQTDRYENMVVRGLIPRAIKQKEFLEAAWKDPELNDLRSHMIARPKARLPMSLRVYASVYDQLSMDENGTSLKAQKLVIPECLRERVVGLAHVGHQGMVKTKQLLRSRVWFPWIDAMVEQKVNKCREC